MSWPPTDISRESCFLEGDHLGAARNVPGLAYPITGGCGSGRCEIVGETPSRRSTGMLLPVSAG